MQDEILSFFFTCLSLHFFHFFPCRGQVSFQQVVQQLVDIPAVFRHTFFQYEVGVGGVAQQLCPFASQVDDTLDDFKVVVFVVVRADGIPCHIHFPAEFPIVGVGHERIIARGVQGEDPSLQILFLGSQCGSFDSRFRKAGQILFVCQVELEFIGFFQIIL